MNPEENGRDASYLMAEELLLESPNCPIARLLPAHYDAWELGLSLTEAIQYWRRVEYGFGINAWFQ